MKKIIIITACVMILSAVGFTSYWAGSNMSKAQTDTSSIAKTENMNNEVPKLIAVVNLDEGTVLTNNETIYYGEKIIRFSDDTFVYTSLEDARRGIENDTYGAYIIIPSTFSQNVESLNNNPNQSILKYALNTNLDGKKQKDMLYQVLSFGDMLNNDVSYMYLANILNEFHQAQDITSTVMNNDLKEKNTIDEIQASDLVEMVMIPDLEREENNLAILDITEFVTNNNDLIRNIDDEYKNYIDDSMEQVTNLNENGKTLSQSLTDLSANIGEIKLQTDEKGNILYEKGVDSLAKSISDYNKKLQASKSFILTEADELENQRKYIADALEISINKYNEQLKKEFNTLLTTHKKDLNKSLPSLVCTVVEDTNGKQFKITSNNIEGKAAAPSILISIVSDDLETVAQRKECLNNILNKLLVAKDEAETIEVTLEKQITPEQEEGDTTEGEPKEDTLGESTPEEEEATEEEETPEEEETQEDTIVTITDEIEVNKSVFTALAECDLDADILQKLNECGYNNTLDFIQDVLTGDIAMEATTYLKVDGNVNSLETYMKSGMDNIKENSYQITGFTDQTYDESGKAIQNETNDSITISSLLEKYSGQIQEIKPDIVSIEEVDSQAIKDIVNNSCVSPLIERTEKVKKIFEQRYSDEVLQVETYQTLLAAYNPVKDTDKIDDYVSQMDTNSFSMQENVRDTNQEYVDFTEKVYTTTEENLTSLRTHIEEAKEVSKNAVESGLAEAKSVKETTSKQNQLMMAEFAQKLPYTRLGSMEYTQAYEFIASPLKLMQVSNYQRLKDDVSILADTKVQESTGKSQEIKNETYIKWSLYLLLAVMLMALIIHILLQRKKNGKRNPEYIGS